MKKINQFKCKVGSMFSRHMHGYEDSNYYHKGNMFYAHREGLIIYSEDYLDEDFISHQNYNDNRVERYERWEKYNSNTLEKFTNHSYNL